MIHLKFEEDKFGFRFFDPREPKLEIAYFFKRMIRRVEWQVWGFKLYNTEDVLIGHVSNMILEYPEGHQGLPRVKE